MGQQERLITKQTKDLHCLERLSPSWSKDSVRLINTPTLTARSTFFYVQEAGYFETMPPYFTERENLNSFLIVYTLSGQGRLHYEGAEYILSAKQAFYIDCRKHHYYECIGDSGWEMLWVHFNGNGALGYYEEFAQSGFRIITWEDTQVHGDTSPSMELQELTEPSVTEQNLRRILDLTRKKERHAELICSTLLIHILTELLIQNSREHLSLTAVPPYLKDVLTYLDRNFKESISLEQLSRQFGISRYHLSREFHRHFGRTFMDCLIEKRLNYAKELLRFSTLPVSEITFACGMNHTSHFIRLFKRQEGLTPFAYRKAWTQ